MCLLQHSPVKTCAQAKSAAMRGPQPKGSLAVRELAARPAGALALGVVAARLRAGAAPWRIVRPAALPARQCVVGVRWSKIRPPFMFLMFSGERHIFAGGKRHVAPGFADMPV